MIKQYISISVVVLLLLAACEKENENHSNEKQQKISIASGDGNGGLFSATLLANDTLFEGYNNLFVEIKASDGDMVTSGNISFHPVMHMTTMRHAAPAENPEQDANEDGFFEGAVVFIMPSNPDEGWTLDVAIDADGMKDTTSLIIPVVKSLPEARLLRVVSDIDETKYFISLLEPSNPIVGINDIEFTVHTKKSMMSFPAVDDVTITIEPEMPSMGHGSPNNVNPESIGEGHYLGKVNFTMTGWWRINITLKKGNEIIADDIFVDVTF